MEKNLVKKVWKADESGGASVRKMLLYRSLWLPNEGNKEVNCLSSTAAIVTLTCVLVYFPDEGAPLLCVFQVVLTWIFSTIVSAKLLFFRSPELPSIVNILKVLGLISQNAVFLFK